MAETAPADGARFIDVKVLSQLPSPHGTIHFHSILASTTVRELKTRIQDVVPSNPPPESLRFIHQGRVVARDSDTLVDIFGRQAIESPITHVLHLVIRDTSPSAHPQRPQQDAASRIPTPPWNAPVAPTHLPAGQQAPGPRLGLNSQFPVPQHLQAIQSNIAQMQQFHNAASLHPHVPAVVRQTPFSGSAPPPAHPPHFPLQPAQQPGLPPGAMHGPLDLNAIVQQQIQQAIAASQQHSRPFRAPFAHGNPVPNAGQPAEHGDTTHSHDEPLRGTTSGQATSGQAPGGDSSSHQLPDLSTTGSRDGPTPPPNVQPSSISQQGVGPNAERWTFTSTSTTSSAPNHLPHLPWTPPLMQTQLGQGPTPDSPHLHFPLGPGPHQNFIGAMPFPMPMMGQTVPPGMNRTPSINIPPYNGYLGPHHTLEYLRNLQSQFETAMHTCRLRVAPEPDASRPIAINNAFITMRAYIFHRNRAQQFVNNVLTNGPAAGQAGPTPQQVAELHSLNDRFQGLVRNLTSEFSQLVTPHNDTQTADSSGSLSSTVPSPRPTDNPIAAPTSTPANPTPGMATSGTQTSSTAVTAYLLRSPAGPQAVLYSREGVFRSRLQSHGDSIRNQLVSTSTETNPRHGARGQHQQANVDAHAGGQQLLLANPERPVPGHLPFLQQILDIQQQQGANAGANAVAVNLTPFFQAAWFFIRGYAFMWLFLGGRGTDSMILSWRSLVLLLLSIGYGAIQAGIGTEQIALVRRYWNELVGVRPEPAQAEQGQQAGRDANQGDGAAAAPATGLAAGQRDTAAQQRQPGQTGAAGGNEGPRAQGGPLREWLRVFERTIALFLASLYPGVGERHIAERDRARREIEERDRARAAAASTTASASAATEGQTQDSSQSSGQEKPSPQSGQETQPSAPVTQDQGSSSTDNEKAAAPSSS